MKYEDFTKNYECIGGKSFTGLKDKTHNTYTVKYDATTIPFSKVICECGYEHLFIET